MNHSRDWYEGAIAALESIRGPYPAEYIGMHFSSYAARLIKSYRAELDALPPLPPAPEWALVEELKNTILLAKNVCIALKNGTAKSFPFTPERYESELDAALARIEKARAGR